MPSLRALFFLFAFLVLPQAQGANSVMIWPIDPAIDPEDKASELWLENRGNTTTLMQVRIFAWQQTNNQGAVSDPAADCCQSPVSAH